MTTQVRHDDALTADEKRRREDTLTQDAPSKNGTTAGTTILKHGDVYLLTDDAGDIPWDVPHVCGLFRQDCRFVNGLLLRIDGERPAALSTSHIGEQHSAHVLTNGRALPQQQGEAVTENTIAIRRWRELRHGVVYEHIRFANHDTHRAVLRVSIRVRCEFEDVFVVKGFSETMRGALSPPSATDERTLQWSYRGRDQQLRRTILAFDPAPDEIHDDEAHFVVDLSPGAEAVLALTITAVEGDGPPRVCRPDAAAEDLGRHGRRAEARWLGSATSLRSSDELFDHVLHRALLDLRLLRSRLGRHHYFAGGVPWFVTLFGRDSIIAAMQTLAYGPAIAKDTLLLLAHYQADRYDPYRDAEPGKILHELRRGELAHLGEIPQSPVYYGTVDATMLFLILAAEYLAWSGDLATIEQIRPNLDAALRWMATCDDHDEDGYFDYVGQYENGLVNQAWKDSGQAIVNADGSIAEPPIATVEVQSYAYLAWRQSAVMLRALGAGREADEIGRRADGLRSRFAGDFWSDDLGCYVLARQHGGRPAAVVSSNAGQVLWGGIATADHARRTIARLMQDDMFSGWGLRTLSARERRYDPISYHRGSVWPHDNSLILAGARRYGADDEALRIFDALFAAAVYLPGLRLPEVFCGFARHRGEPPVPYPHASAPQAWAAGALPYMVWTLLGLRPDAVRRRLDIVRPVLPQRLEWIELDRLRVGDSAVRLRFERRRDGSVGVDADVHGDLDVNVDRASSVDGNGV